MLDGCDIVFCVCVILNLICRYPDLCDVISEITKYLPMVVRARVFKLFSTRTLLMTENILETLSHVFPKINSISCWERERKVSALIHVLVPSCHIVLIFAHVLTSSHPHWSSENSLWRNFASKSLSANNWHSKKWTWGSGDEGQWLKLSQDDCI